MPRIFTFLPAAGMAISGPSCVPVNVCAKAMASSGDSSRARDELLIAERLDPDNDVIHYRLAKSFRESGDSEAANRELILFKKARASRLPSRSALRHDSEPDDGGGVEAPSHK